MVEIDGVGLLIQPVGGKTMNVYGPVTYSAEHDCYYCDGQSWPKEIAEVVK